MEGNHFGPAPSPNEPSTWQTYQPDGGPPSPPRRPEATTPQMGRDFLKQVRKRGGRVFLLVVILQVIANLLAIVFMRAAVFTGGGSSNGMLTFLTSYLPCLIADLICILLGLPLLKPDRSERILASPKEMNGFGTWGILACLGAANAGAVLFSWLATFLDLAGVKIQIPNLDVATGDPFSSLLTTLYVCLLGPICEELLFRGIILKALKPWGSMTAIIVSSIAFAVFHGNPVQFVTPLFVGLLLGYLTIRCNSILPAILAHVLNNSLRTLPTLFFSVDSLILASFSSLIVLAGNIFLIIFLLRYSHGMSRIYHEEERQSGSIGTKLKWICVSPWTILTIVLYLGLVVLFCFNYVSLS